MARTESANSKGPAAKTTPKRGRPAAGARSGGKKSSDSHNARAKPSRTKEATKRGPRKPSKASPAAAAAPVPPKASEESAPQPPSIPQSRGRPKDTPDVWTPEHIEEVANQLWDYIEATTCPSLPEFCFKYLVRRQRIYEIPELLELKEFLYAKRAAALEAKGLSLTRDDGPRGAFICKAISNVGDFSMVEKTESVSRVQSTHVYLPDNGRGDGPKPEGEHA